MTNGVNVLKVLLVPSIIPIGISWVTTFSNFRYPASFNNSETLSPDCKAEFITDSKAGEIFIVILLLPTTEIFPSSSPISTEQHGYPAIDSFPPECRCQNHQQGKDFQSTEEHGEGTDPRLEIGEYGEGSGGADLI